LTDKEALDLVQLYRWPLLPVAGGKWVAVTLFGATEPVETVREAIRAVNTSRREAPPMAGQQATISPDRNVQIAYRFNRLPLAYFREASGRLRLTASEMGALADIAHGYGGHIRADLIADIEVILPELEKRVYG
jgi:hypothetical protein